MSKALAIEIIGWCESSFIPLTGNFLCLLCAQSCARGPVERKTDIRYIEAERLPPSSAWLRRPIEFNNSICMAAVSALHNTPVRSHYHSHYTDQETEAASGYMCGSSQPSHLQGTEQKLILGSVKDCTTMPHRFPALRGVVWMYLTLLC